MPTTDKTTKKQKVTAKRPAPTLRPSRSDGRRTKLLRGPHGTEREYREAL